MHQKLLLFLFWLWLSPSASGDVMILAHGYLGDGDSWQSSGITRVVEKQGWVNGGRLVPGAPAADASASAPGNVIDTLDLPSTARLAYQADVLWARVNQGSDLHPDEPVLLVGHSAGGVVGRLALVRFGPGPVETLISIASPHLGTPRALQGLDVIQDSGPFEFVKELVGGQDYRRVKQSGGTLWDLAPPRPGNLLYWLNGREHPDIRYVSVIRLPGPDGEDDIVPAYSQDMNQVPALRGQAEVVPTPGDHFLDARDGMLLHQLATNHPSRGKQD
mgnify:FL=1